MTERTPEQHIVFNAWAAFRPAHFVSRLGRSWVVEVKGYRTPKVSRTKRDAVAHADARVQACVERAPA